MMNYEIKRNAEEIGDVLDKAQEGADGGTAWPGMSYEEGVLAAILWLTGSSDTDPMAD